MPKSLRPHALLALVIAALLALLALGLWLGGHPRDLPGFIRSTFVANSKTQVVDEAIEAVAHDYYREVGAEKLASASIAGMVSSLRDPYSEYLAPKAFRGFDQPATFTGIGVSIQANPEGLKIVHVFNGSPAARAGLKGGEVIVKANGRSLGKVPVNNAAKMIKGPPGTDVKLDVKDGDGPPADVKVTRETITTPLVSSKVRMFDGMRLGWAYLASFSEGAHGQLGEAVKRLMGKGVKGIVLDLRGNGGGLVSEAQLVASLFLKSGVIVTTRGRAQPTVVLKAVGGAIAPSIPMVVLVDHSTASAAEIVTAALQDHDRAEVVGTHTYGKGVFQELERLSNGAGLKLTVGEYFTPDGRNLGGGGVNEGAGITPEVVVKHDVDTEHGIQVALSALAQEIR